MTRKERALLNWQSGDDSEAVRRILRKHGIRITREALRQYRKGGGSLIEPHILTAYESIQRDRERAVAGSVNA